MYTLKTGEREISREQARSLTINERFKSFVAMGATFDFKLHPQIIVKTTASGRDYMKFVFPDGKTVTCSQLMRAPSNPDDLGADNRLAHATSGPEVLDLIWDHVVSVSSVVTAKGRDFGDAEDKEHKYSVWKID